MGFATLELVCLLVLARFLGAVQAQSPLDQPPFNATAFCQDGQAAVGFTSGVASGDPTQDAVVIWTRFEPPDKSKDWPVEWVVASNPDLSSVVTNGTATARPDADFTVKIDITGLRPNTTYYYAFRQGNYSSHLGITKTLPALTQDVGQLRYAITSCANWGYGYFNVYHMVARVKDLDFVIQLGDYIYEYNTTYYPSERAKVRHELIPPREIYTLSDYQQRHRLYKTDPYLQELQRRVPMLAIWDDHDQADNSWEDGSFDTSDPAVWARRKANAATAYKQYVPVRENRESLFELYRTFNFGDIATIILPETRLEYRTEQLDPMNHPYIQALADHNPDEWDNIQNLPDLRKNYIDDFLKAPNMSQLGPQLEFVERDFGESKSAGIPWQIFASPTIFSPRRTPDIEQAIKQQYGRLVPGILNAFLQFGTSDLASEQLQFGSNGRVMVGTGRYHDTIFLDSWDGYEFEREELIDIFANSTNNPVVVTGDSHNAWASNLYKNMVKFTPNASVSTDGPVIGVEYATASVTAPGTEAYVEIIPLNSGNVLDILELGLNMSNPELLYANLKDRGAIILTCTKQEMKGDYYYVSTIKLSDYDVSCQESLKVTAGQMSNGLQVATCTDEGELLYQLYTADDPLPQAATLSAPAFPGTNVSNCGPGGSPPFIPVTFNSTFQEEQGDNRREGGIVKRTASAVTDKVSSWFG